MNTNRIDPIQFAGEEPEDMAADEKRVLIASAGFITGPNYDTPSGRLYRSAGTATNVWERDLFDLIDAARRTAQPAANALEQLATRFEKMNVNGDKWISTIAAAGMTRAAMCRKESP